MPQPYAPPSVRTLDRTYLKKRTARRRGCYLNNTQQTHENILVLSGIQTHNPKNQAAADLRLLPHDRRGQRHRQILKANINEYSTS